jgi:spermidine/putrescine transport system substrate-binding protein
MSPRREQGSISRDLWVPDRVNPRLNRRELLQAGAGLAIGAGLAGCGIGRGLQGDTERVIEPKIDGDLNYFNYSQYINPALVKEFEERYDVRVNQSYFDSMEGMLAKLRGGNAYDVMFPTAEYVQRMIQTQQLLRIPRDKLENIDNIYAYFEDPWYDPDSAHSVPYSLYITGIGYRADQVTMTGSWNDLGNEEAAGRIYVLDDYQEALAAGNLLHGFDMNTVVESELETTKDWLIGLKPLLRGFSVDTITNMSSGNAWIEHLWNGDIVNIRYRVDNPDDYVFQKCEEGFPVGSDCFVIPVNAEHPGTALLFIDFMLDPKNASKNCTWNGYPMPNTGADEAFAELVKDDPTIQVTVEDLEKGDQFANLPQEDRELWNRIWTEVKAA